MDAFENREKDIFFEALEHPESERSAFVDSACGDDHTLRIRVHDLLDRCRPEPILDTETDVWPSPPQSFVGKTIAHFTLTSRIGTGGMGEVYRSKDTKLGRDVAIKILSKTPYTQDGALRRFEREATVLASLNHPNISTIYGIENLEGSKAIVMELVEGDTLAERLKAERLTPSLSLEIMRQIASAVQAAHEKGIVHRDLKPANVKFMRDGQVKVLDFGLAKNTMDSNGGVIGDTLQGALLGTPAYMSPEQTRGQPVDERTDVWAFGCCLYECLAGQPAFRGRTISEIGAEVLKEDPDFSLLHPDTPPQLRRLLRRCLQKDADRRPRDLGEIADLLDRPQLTPWRHYSHVAAGVLLLATTAGAWLAHDYSGTNPAKPKKGGRATQHSTPSEFVGASEPTPIGMTLIPVGKFMMGDQSLKGDEDELPAHEVELLPYFIDRFEISQEMWDHVRNWGLSDGGYQSAAYAGDIRGIHEGKAEGPLHPIHSVTWYDAVKWCNIRSEMEGLTPAYYEDVTFNKVYRSGRIDLTASHVKWDADGYRLPTEAEWERAARGGVEDLDYPWGPTISKQHANYLESDDPFEGGSISKTTPVGFYSANRFPESTGHNPYDLYDMAGNVWEWCFDWYSAEYYSARLMDSPKGPASSLIDRRVLKGGSWGNPVKSLRCAERGNLKPSSAVTTTGFRCVRSR